MPVDVVISSLESPLIDNVKKILTIANDKNSGSRALSLHARASEEIKKALQPFGYYHPKIDASLVKKENLWQASYSIEKGRPTTIGLVSISIEGGGIADEILQQRVKNTALQKGTQLNHTAYESTKKALLNTAFDRGYLDVTYRMSEISVDLETYSATINLVLTTGERYFFDSIVIEQSILNKNYLDRFVKIQAGEPYRSQSLLNLQLDLLNTNYFRTIDVETNKKNAVDYRIPVVIRTTPSVKQRYVGSIGYGTDTGYRMGLGYTNTRATKTGHQFTSKLRLSEVESLISAQYKMPIGNPTVEFIDVTASFKAEEIDDSDSTQYNVGSSYNVEFFNGILRAFISLEQEDFSFGDQSSQRSNLLIPGVSYFSRQTKNTLFSRDGYSVFASLHGGVRSVYSETSFLQVKASLKNVTPITNASRLLSRLEVGKIVSTDFDSLPPSQRFFSGGSRTIRGFSYQSIGQEDDNGNNIGGNSLVVASTEFDYLFKGNMGVAAFYDVGDVGLDESSNLKQSIGVGFRYRSPIGMIRIDVAKPIDSDSRRSEEDDIRFHFSMGPDL